MNKELYSLEYSPSNGFYIHNGQLGQKDRSTLSKSMEWYRATEFSALMRDTFPELWSSKESNPNFVTIQKEFTKWVKS